MASELDEAALAEAEGLARGLSRDEFRHVTRIAEARLAKAVLRLVPALRAARQRIAELEGERRKVVPAYQDACGRLYLGTTHAQALEAAEALGAVIPDDSCGGWLMSDGTYLPQHPATPAAREGE